MRKFSVINKSINKENIVTQIHLTCWEDYTALEKTYFNQIIKIINIIDCSKKSNYKPCVVHCSAGVGRTGTLICLYNLYHEIMQQIYGNDNTNIITFCIMNLVRKMKEMRIYSIQNENQFLLLYDFANYLLVNNNIKK